MQVVHENGDIGNPGRKNYCHLKKCDHRFTNMSFIEVNEMLESVFIICLTAENQQ